MCVDCFNNCGDTLVLDRCIKYTGEDIELLDICKGDPISKVEQAIIEKLLTALDGTGILPKDITLNNAPKLKEALGIKSPSLNNLLQILIDENKSLREIVTTLSIKDVFVFDKKCLTNVPANPSSDQILQGAVNMLCTLNTAVTAIPNQYVKQSDLPTLVKEITKPSTTITSYHTLAIPYTVYEYYGPLSNFDNTGKGLASQGFDKLYLCNGQNGTPDKRGRVTAGAVRNVPGGALDAAVDPTLAINSNTNYGLKEKFGSNYHILDISQMPNHNHTLTDPGHEHEYDGFTEEGRPAGDKVNRDDKKLRKKTSNSKTGISIAPTGGGQPHENRQPSIAAYYYMYIP